MAELFTGPAIALGLAVALVIGGLIALGVRFLEARSRCEEEASRLQQALSEPLVREPALRGSAVLLVASVPRRGRARVEVTGTVPSREARDAALRAVQREAARLGWRVRVVDQLEVFDSMRRPA
jgi:hypothetical protein